MNTDDNNRVPYRTRSTLELAVEADPNLIKGIFVPMDVQIQLHEAGIIATQLLAGEMREAIAADISGQVLNDPGGTSFLDRLRKTADENRSPPDADDDDINPDADDDGGKKHEPRKLAQDQRRKHAGFVKELLEKRAAQLKLLATGHITPELT